MIEILKCQYVKICQFRRDVGVCFKPIVLVGFSSYRSQCNVLPQRLGLVQTYFTHIVSYYTRANSCSTYTNSCWKQYPRIGLCCIRVEFFGTCNAPLLHFCIACVNLYLCWFWSPPCESTFALSCCMNK